MVIDGEKKKAINTLIIHYFSIWVFHRGLSQKFMQTSAAISYHCSSAAKKEIKMLGFWTREAIPPVKDARSVGGALRCFRKGEFVYCTFSSFKSTCHSAYTYTIMATMKRVHPKSVRGMRNCKKIVALHKHLTRVQLTVSHNFVVTRGPLPWSFGREGTRRGACARDSFLTVVGPVTVKRGAETKVAILLTCRGISVLKRRL